MSLLLKDKVYTVQSATSKRGIYPLHGYKLGLYRLPIKLEDSYEIDSIVSGFKKVTEIWMSLPTEFTLHTDGKKKTCRDPDGQWTQNL